MKIRFTDIPVFYHHDIYSQEIMKLSGTLSGDDRVLSVYQVGSVSDPGISDVDLFVVLKDNSDFLSNPIEGLEGAAKYIFTHKLFGSSESIVSKTEQFTFFGNYKHLAGPQFDFHNYSVSESDRILLRHQIALEYVVKAFISINIQLFLGSVKLRGFLLHAKAVKYDLEFLDFSDDDTSVLIDEIIRIRKNWFDSKPDEKKLVDLVIEYRNLLEKILVKAVGSYNFFMPPDLGKSIARNIILANSNKVSFASISKVPLVKLLSSSGLSGKIKNRLTSFTMTFPMKESDIPEILLKRSAFMKKAFLYNRLHYPYFICTGHGLNIFNS